MMHRTSVLLLCLLVTVALTHGYRFRQKRVSDQRLAELETIVALNNLKNMKTIPYGFGKVDPKLIGRRRRSSGLLLERIMENLARTAEEGAEDSPDVPEPAYYWSIHQPE